MTPIVVVLGDDKLGHRAAAALQSAFPQLPLYLNRSASPRRIVKLLRRNPHLLGDFLTMFVAERARPDTPISALPVIRTTADMFTMVDAVSPRSVICLRAGLIFGPRLLAAGPEFLNLHYADLPQWGGLAALPAALRAKAYQQHACLHRMTAEVDAGEVIRREPYLLDPKASYCHNEDTGFSAAIQMLLHYLSETTS